MLFDKGARIIAITEANASRVRARIVAEMLNVFEDEVVFEQLSRFDTPLEKETLGKKIEHLRSLEWKYLRK